MKFRIKNLLFFPLIFIVNGKPFNQADYPSLYNNRLLNHNYEEFVNAIHVDNNANVPSVHYGTIMNNNMKKQGIKYANIDVNNAAQDAGTKDNRQPLDRRNEILEPSETTFYNINELYTPLVSIYRSYPMDFYQQQLINDIEHHLFKPEQSRLLDVLFSIETVPYPNPLIFLSEPSPSHSSVVSPTTTNLRRFSFNMPAFPSFGNNFGGFPFFPQSSRIPSHPQNGGFPSFNQNKDFSTFNNFPSFPQNGGFTSYPQNNGYPPQNKGYSYPKPEGPQFGGFPSFSQGWGFTSFPDMDFAIPKMDFTFPDMDMTFKNTFDSKKFLPAVIQDSMRDEDGNTPDLIQVGKNNTNIKSGNQYGIVQVNLAKRKSAMPIITTTEYPDVDETSTLQEETTTFSRELIDWTDEYHRDSVIG